MYSDFYTENVISNQLHGKRMVNARIHNRCILVHA